LSPNVDTCLACGRDIPPGPDFCGPACEADGLMQRSRRLSRDSLVGRENIMGWICDSLVFLLMQEFRRAKKEKI